MSEDDEHWKSIRERIAEDLPVELKDLIVDHLDPVSLIRVANAGYPIPAERARRNLHTYLWKRVLATQFEWVKSNIGEGENMFLVGHGLERLNCGIFEESNEAPAIKLLLGWLPYKNLRPRNSRLKVYRQLEKPQINLMLNFNAFHRGFSVDDLSKYLKKDASGIWTKIAYLYKENWEIDTVKVKMKAIQAGKDWYWFKYEFEIQHEDWRGHNEILHMSQIDSESMPTDPRGPPF